MAAEQSNSTLAAKVAVLEALVPEIKAALQRIEAQTVMTNGRVDSLETTRDQAIGARWAFGVIFTAGVAIGGLVGHLAKW